MARVTIKSFTGANRWLSNFVGGVEQKYQAAKCANPGNANYILSLSPSEAKRVGPQVEVVSNWDNIKLSVMRNLVREKFSKEPYRSKLLATGDCHIEEGNWWGDRFWGVCGGRGLNHLGRIIMEVREELRGGDCD